MAGLFVHGDAFVLRDPNGIRPAFWYEDDEVCVVASERPVIQTAFNLKREQIKELTPGHALIIKKKRNGFRRGNQRTESRKKMLIRADLFFPWKRLRYLRRAQKSRSLCSANRTQNHRLRFG